MSEKKMTKQTNHLAKIKDAALPFMHEYHAIFLLWTLFLCSLLISTILSRNIVNSLYGFQHYAMSYLYFVFVLFVLWSKNKNILIARLILFISLLFVGISLFAYLSPDFSSTLSNDTLFYPVYGHSHLAEWLLFVIPIAWWWYFRSKIIIAKTLPIIFSAYLLISHARIVLILAFLQLLVLLGLFLYTETSKFRKKTKILFIAFSLVFLIALAFGFSGFADSPLCENNILEKMFCKNTALSQRTLYWDQAVQVWLQNPVFGSGMGTFKSASLKFLQIPGYQTAYAHSHVLQLLAETGVVGAFLFFLLLGFIGYYVIKQLVISKDPLLTILSISLFFGVVNAQLDFSWSYHSLWLLFITLSAMVVSQIRFQDKNNSTMPRFARAQIILHSLVFISMFLFVTLYFLATAITFYNVYTSKTSSPTLFLKYVKPLKQYYVDLAVNGSLSDREELFLLHQSDHEILRQLLLRAESESERNKYLNQMYSLDPWFAQIHFSADEYYKENGLDRSVELARDLLEFMKSKKKDLMYVPNYETEKKLSLSLVYLGDLLFSEKRYEEAGYLYSQAQVIDPWILSSHDPVFDLSKVDQEQSDFLSFLKLDDPKFLGSYQADYGEFAFLLTKILLNQEQYLMALSFLPVIEQLSPWNTDDSIDLFYTAITQNIVLIQQNNNNLNEEELAKILVFTQVLRDQLGVLKKNDNQFDLRQKLANQIASVCSAFHNRSSQAYEVVPACLQVAREVAPENYWVSAQLGNYYALVDETEKAVVAFDACLARFENQHDDCYYGKQGVGIGNFNKNRFYEVSQIILGEKRWQDFQ